MSAVATAESDERTASDSGQPAEPTPRSGMTALTSHVQQALSERPTLLVWLIDQSASLDSRRSELADLIEAMHTDIHARHEQLKLKMLTSAVISFRDEVELLTPEPVAQPESVAELIRSLKSDESGRELPFAAIREAAETFRDFSPISGRNKDHHVLFVIFTDERGDDIAQCMEVGAVCAKYQFRVFCLGSVAPFGREKGFVTFRFEDGVEKEISVDQGPESIRLDSMRSPWINDGRISSGFGPFALEFLCRRTGGAFLPVHDSGHHRFDPATMQKYAPFGVEIKQLREFETEVRHNKVKAALVMATELTRKAALRPPPMVFNATTDEVFRGKIASAQRASAILSLRTAELRQLLEAYESDRDSLDSPRWQAAFDLAMGRTLATIVRNSYFELQLAQMKKSALPFKDTSSNTWSLVPAEPPNDNPSGVELTERTRGILQRVIEEHPGTPFAFVAQLERDRAFGWRWIESRKDWPPEPLKRSRPRIITGKF